MFPRRILLLALTMAIADSRSVGQIPSRHIGSEPDGGVEVARGVANERTGSAGGVVVARGVVKERIDSAGGVAMPVVLLKSALTPLAVLKPPVVLLRAH